MDPASRAARGARDRTKPPRDTAVLRKFWSESAAELERQGMKLIRGAMARPTTKTPSNGTQLNPKITAGFKFLDQAEKFYSRLGRIPPPPEAPTTGAEPKPRSLADYRRG